MQDVANPEEPSANLQNQAQEANHSHPISSLSSVENILEDACYDVKISQDEDIVPCRLCQQGVSRAELHAHTKVCLVGQRHVKALEQADVELIALRDSAQPRLKEVCSLARSICPEENDSSHRLQVLLTRAKQKLRDPAAAPSGEVHQLLQLLHDKLRALEGLENLQWRALRAAPLSQPEAPALSPTRKWIYSTLCRASFFEDGAPVSQRRSISSSRRLRRVARMEQLASKKDADEGVCEGEAGPTSSTAALGAEAQSWEEGGSRYVLDESIGKGSMATVYRATEKATGRPFAVKLVKPGMEHKGVKEASVLRMCSNEHILQLHEVFLGGKTMALVLELADCDLFEMVLNADGLPEYQARPLFNDLLGGLQWLHSKGIYHRDIKLENCLLCGTRLKIADFDLSAIQTGHATGEGCQQGRTYMQTTPCGTFAYSAPEVLAHQNYIAAAVDAWSTGVCLFAMLICEFPFESPSEDCHEFVCLLRDCYPWPETFSPEAVGLLKELLCVEPTLRVLPAVALQHEWCRQ